MKQFWTALAVAIAAIFGLSGCNDYGNTFQNNTGALLSFLSPSQISAGGSDFTLTLQGSGFVLKTVVQWNGKTLATTVPVDSTGAALGNVVTAAVPAGLVAKPGVATVLTVNPASGAGNNGLSNSVAFIINPPPNPLPGLTSISPTNAAAGSPQLTLMLNGSSFLPATDPSGGSQVSWSFNGAQKKLAVLPGGSSSQIQATVTSDLLVNSGSTNLTANVTVFNPPSPAPSGCITACTGGGGGGSSAPAIFTICPSTGCPPGTTAASAAAALVAEETPALSLDGRYVAYTAMQNDRAQIFVRDTCEGAPTSCQPHTTLLSAAADGTPANDESHAPSMSSDAGHLCWGGGFLQIVGTAHLHRSDRRVGRNGKHFAFSELFGTLYCVSRHHAEPFVESVFRSVEAGRQRQQQRLPPGVHPRYVSRCDQLHAEDDPDFASAR
jgi:hypothetical protein